MDELNRCFIGIRLPGEAQQKLSEVQTAIRQKAGSDVVRWTNPQDLNIIIMALGELPVGRVVQVKPVIAGIAPQVQPFELTLEGLGGTPSALQPRFPWVGIGGDVQDLTNLHMMLEKALMPYLPGYQSLPFKAHVDLGRLKIESEQNRTALGRSLRMNPTGCVYRMAVDRFELLRSTAGVNGVQLVTEEAYRLGA